jgi:hypothetical protein
VIVATGVVLGALALIFLTLLVPLALWLEVDDSLHSFLEALPFGSAVATTPDEHGNPVLVGVLFGVPILAGLVVLTIWRRGLVRRFVEGRLPWSALFGASVLRMAAILAAIPLVVVLVGLSTGADLRDTDDRNDLFGGWQALVAGAGLLAFSFLGQRRAIGRRLKKVAPPPAADDTVYAGP